MTNQTQGHTPGPWRASECMSTCNVNILETGKRDGVVIGILNRSTAVENRANARLIAAAPELLEALKELLSYEDVIHHSANKAILKAKQVLAKAEGKG